MMRTINKFFFLLIIVALASCEAEKKTEFTVNSPFESNKNYHLVVARKSGSDLKTELVENIEANNYTKTYCSFFAKSITTTQIEGVWALGKTQRFKDNQLLETDMANELLEGVQVDFKYDIKSKSFALNNYEECFNIIQDSFHKIWQTAPGDTSMNKLRMQMQRTFIMNTKTPHDLVTNYFPELSLLVKGIGQTYSLVNQDTTELQTQFGNLNVYGYSDLVEYDEGEETEYELIKEDTISKTEYDALVNGHLKRIYGDGFTLPSTANLSFDYSNKNIFNLNKDGRLEAVEETKYYSYPQSTRILRTKITVIEEFESKD